MLMKEKKIPYRAIIAVCVVIAIVILSFAAFDTRLETTYVTVESDKISRAVRVALISDLHSCDYGENQSELVTAIDAQNPDVVALCGDIFDDVLTEEKTLELLNAISEKYPCWYVTGNHEYWSGRADYFVGKMKEYGINVLEGESQTVEINSQSLTICGVTDPDAVRYAGFPRSTAAQLASLANERDEEIFTLLISHRPELFEQYASHGFDLVLSGHAHGGQWRIPKILNGLYAPNQGLFPKYTSGAHTSGDTTMVVSRGLARETTRIPRICNRPELVIVNIV